MQKAAEMCGSGAAAAVEETTAAVEATTEEEKDSKVEAIQCCPPGAFPQLDPPKDYKPAGKWIELDGTKAYATGSMQWDNAIIVIHDVYGPQTGYHYGVCDAFAAGGYYVIMPDFYETVGGVDNYWSKGDLDGGAKFLQKFTWEFIQGKLKPVKEHLKEKNFPRVGSLGFCWGAWVVARMSEDPDFLKAGVWFHPSLWVDAKLFGGEDETKITEKVAVPTLFCPSMDEKRDFWDYELGKAILEKKGVPTDYIAFNRMHHGWMTRGAGGAGISFIQAGGDEFDTVTAQDVNRGISAALGYFAKYLFLDTSAPAPAEPVAE